MQLFTKQNEVDAILENIQRIAEALYLKGWSEKNAGNISVQLPCPVNKKLLVGLNETKLEIPLPSLKRKSFYVTASGKRMHDLAFSTTDNGLFIQMNDDGSAYTILKHTDDELKPTSEFNSHMGIHNMIAERGTDETTVLHTHATKLIVLTQHPQINTEEALNNIIFRMHPEANMYIPKGIGYVPYTLPGSKEIANKTLESFRKYDVVVWEKHGVFAIGKNVTDTFDNIDIICKSANIWLQCKAAGFEPSGLSDEQINELRKL